MKRLQEVDCVYLWRLPVIGAALAPSGGRFSKLATGGREARLRNVPVIFFFSREHIFRFV